MSFHDLEIVVPAMIRAADRLAGSPIAWPAMEIPDDATTVPASMIPSADLISQLCRLSGNISTMDGNVYPAGAIFECVSADHLGRLTISGNGLRIVQIPPHALEVILR